MISRDEGDQARLLSDIVFWGERLASHLSQSTEKKFSEGPLLIDAACWCIICVGEASGKLVQRWPDLAERLADLELSKAYAMRNRLSHGYFTIDVGVVWRAATVSVPALVEKARQARDAH